MRLIRLVMTAGLMSASATFAWMTLSEDAWFINAADAKPAAKAMAPTPAIAPQHLYLIRSALGALQDANATGNYSVLRDLAAPSFQAKHSAADLAELFAAARRRPIDLSPVAYLTPVITETARPDPAQLSLSGYVPAVGASGERITFTLQFEAVKGHWRFAGVALATAKEAAISKP